MKNLTTEQVCELAGIDEIGELGFTAIESYTLSQHVTQYDNMYMSVYILASGETIVEQYSGVIDYFLADKFEDPEQYLQDLAASWARETEHEQLERLAWGLDTTADIEVYENYTGECKIIVEYNCYGYDPIGYVSDYDYDSAYPTIFESWEHATIFESWEHAMDWIDRAESRSYVLQQNEAGRPVYTIVAD